MIAALVLMLSGAAGFSPPGADERPTGGLKPAAPLVARARAASRRSRRRSGKLLNDHFTIVWPNKLRGLRTDRAYRVVQGRGLSE
ncbi:MAG TPA: hypothetical protein VND45_03700 [Thermoanaerobaculia bacterium]|nr:hypothetical protein [Thermoanaerobaculia bacterium]